MKRFIYLLVLFVFTTIVNATETITIKGKITNSTDGKLYVRGESFEKEIILKADGSFSELLNIPYHGSYFISTSQNRVTIYLAKGSDLQITGDDLLLDLKFAGKGAVENQYIVEKTAILNSIGSEELYRLNETDFIKKISELQSRLLVKYNKTKFSDSEFKKNELRSLHFIEQLYFFNFPKYHAHYAMEDGFISSGTFPQLDSKIDMDSESDYLFSNVYKQLLSAKFNEALEKHKKLHPEMKMMEFALRQIKKYESQSIRNGLVQALSYEIAAGKPDSEYLYNEVMGISSDQKFKTELTEKYNKIKTLIPGKLSPQFDYENHAGGKTALSSLKGKYVYIDVWATWCGPCRQEIPSLQKVEEQYHGKNIEFVSISIDARKDYDKWKTMVTDKKLGGMQVFADNDWSSQFVKDYAIDGIPRFIIVGPDGNIVNADAPRPSDPKLIELFNSLKI